MIKGKKQTKIVTRFFVKDVPLRIVRRYENGDDVRTERFNERGYEWVDAGGLYLSIVGMGGDCDFAELTLKEAREIIGVIIPEHFTRADKYLFKDLPDPEKAKKVVPKNNSEKKLR